MEKKGNSAPKFVDMTSPEDNQKKFGVSIEKEERLYDVYALDEDIKILEDLKNKKYYFSSSWYTTGYFELDKKEKQAIEHLIEAYRKVKEEELHWKGQYHLLSRKIAVIPKSKIKEKIEELYEREWVFNEIRDEIIDVLQELLEEE